MGCCSSSEAQTNTAQIFDKTIARQTLTIYGDYFDSDSRALVTMLAIAGYAPEVRIIDQFQGDHTKAEFAQINPI